MKNHIVAALRAAPHRSAAGFGFACLVLLAACNQEPSGKPPDLSGKVDQSAKKPLAQLTPPPSPKLKSERRFSPFVSARKDEIRPVVRPENRENYAKIDPSPIKRALDHPVSTFSVDVDTGSYANVRRFLRDGRLPPHDAVRIEEMVNYFRYGYAPPKDRETPFSVSTAVARTPWNKETYLVRVGIKGYDVPRMERPAANLVFLVDVSGSMNSKDKLPLLVSSLKMLTERLGEKDRVTLVVYAGAAGVVLQPTPGNRKAEILAALDRLKAGGSTAGGAGIVLAYSMARMSFIKGGINRVILATDGDFNVGLTDRRQLLGLIKANRQTGITLTTLGFGTGNYNEALMERAADVGNGNYAYIDSLEEARKVLVSELTSTLFTIAKDVKVQVEFNPAVVAEYRLIGYENRALRREDFNNDKVDAGDIGAGHQVTAIYEVALVGSKGLRMPPLKFSKPPALTGDRSLFAHMKLRYKLPGSTKSRLIDVPMKTAMIEKARAPEGDFAFAAAVAAYGQMLRGGTYLGDFDYAAIRALANKGRGDDPEGYRAGFIRLLGLAETLTPKALSSTR